VQGLQPEGSAAPCVVIYGKSLTFSFALDALEVTAQMSQDFLPPPPLLPSDKVNHCRSCPHCLEHKPFVIIRHCRHCKWPVPLHSSCGRMSTSRALKVCRAHIVIQNVVCACRCCLWVLMVWGCALGVMR
jgi:hypothetical protein